MGEIRSREAARRDELTGVPPTSVQEDELSTHQQLPHRGDRWPEASRQLLLPALLL